MFCPKCGKEIIALNGSKFCSNCGEKLPQDLCSEDVKVEDVEAAQEDTATSVAAGETSNEETSNSNSAAGEASTNAESASAQATTPATTVTKTYSESCFGAAWRDVKESDGWFGKMLLLALIQMVPILNFSSKGYISRWAADVSVGKRFTLPKIQIGPYFKIGFFLIVFDVILGIALSIAVGILNVVPLVGAVAVMALTFMMTGWQLVSEIKVVTKDSIAGGFDFKMLWNAYTKKLGTLVCNGILSQIVFAICACIVIGIAFIIIAVICAGLGFSVYYLSYGMESFPLLSGGVSLVILLIILVFGYVASAILVLGDVLAMRAVGHYLKRHVPEWAQDDVRMPEIPGAQG